MCLAVLQKIKKNTIEPWHAAANNYKLDKKIGNFIGLWNRGATNKISKDTVILIISK